MERYLGLILVFVLGGLLLVFSWGKETALAMEMNLNLPYEAHPSGPRKAELTFYAKQTDDLMFTTQNPVEIYCQAYPRSVSLRWTLSRNLFRTPFLSGQAEAKPGNIFVIRIPSEKLIPGFYDLRVWLNTGEQKEIDGICTFGYRAEQMAVRDSRPADFQEFWARAKQELDKIPLEPETGEIKVFRGKEIDAYNLASACLPGDYDPAGHRTETVEACKVSFASISGQRVYGWLAKPEGKGPFPAMLVLPGAGYNPRPIPLEHARHGYLALDIQVHGQDVDLAPSAYHALENQPEYTGFSTPDKYYYYHIYLNVLQALNYLFSRPDVDPHRVVVVGGSQGGRLTIVAAALDQRVAAIVPAITHFANLPYIHWAANAGGSDGLTNSGPPPLSDTPQNRVEAYYDVLNFAPDVTCPVLMNMGLIDPVSPPSTVYAVYLRLSSKNKHLVVLPELGHDWSAEFDRRAWRWLEALGK